MSERPKPILRVIEGGRNPDGRPWFERPPNQASAHRWQCYIRGRKHLEIVKD